MRESGGSLVQGSIAWANVSDPRGNVKRRPVIIITDSDEILLDSPIVAVPITTSYPEPAPANCIELPWHPRRHPATQLARRSAAVCDWVVELVPSQLEPKRGFVPTKRLLQIIERVRELNPDPEGESDSAGGD